MDTKEKYFSNISNRERAIFEGAISMGALFHQFVGTPFNKTNIASLEKAMEESFALQPCIDKVEVSIDLDRLDKAMTEFEYTSLSGDMLDVKIYSKVDDVLAVIRIKFIEELNYPLMFVEEIIEYSFNSFFAFILFFTFHLIFYFLIIFHMIKKI